MYKTAFKKGYTYEELCHNDSKELRYQVNLKQRKSV